MTAKPEFVEAKDWREPIPPEESREIEREVADCVAAEHAARGVVATETMPSSMTGDEAQKNRELAVRNQTIQQWANENMEAFECSNAYVEKYGLPLAKYRMF